MNLGIFTRGYPYLLLIAYTHTYAHIAHTHTHTLSLSLPLSLTHSLTQTHMHIRDILGFRVQGFGFMNGFAMLLPAQPKWHAAACFFYLFIFVSGIFTKGLPLLGFYHPEDKDMRRRIEFDFEAPQLDEEEDTCHAPPPGLAGEQFWEFAPRRSFPDNMTLCA